MRDLVAPQAILNPFSSEPKDQCGGAKERGGMRIRPEGEEREETPGEGRSSGRPAELQ